MAAESSEKDDKGPVKFGGIPSNAPGLYSQKHLQDRIEYVNELGQIAQTALKDAIKRATETQEWIKTSNQIMFGFGIILIIIAVAVGFFTDKEVYSALFGGVGFLQIVASFFVGSMQRSQKAISDLIQVEIAYLNYFEQVTLWEQYATVLDNSGKIDRTNIEKAADKIHACAKDTLDLLQKMIEDNSSQ